LLARLLNRFKNLSRHAIAKDASWMMAGQGTNFFLRAGYFIILARLLGPVQFGIFAGVVALVSVVAPYSALGSGLLFMRYVSRDKLSGAVYWGNALFTTVVMTVLITGVFMFIAPAITGNHDRVLLFNLIVANCLFTKTTDVASKVYRTYLKLRLSATMTMLANLSQFLIVLVMWLTMSHATATQWSFGAMAATGIATLLTVTMVTTIVGKISLDLRLIKNQFVEGLTYSVSTTSQSLYNDIDKTMLSHYGMNLQNGFYTLAYRIIDFSFTPIGAIDLALLPRLFALSHKDPKEVPKKALKATAVAVGIGALIACVIWVLAPLVPRIVGKGYGPALQVLRWISLIPLLRSIHIVLGNSLTANGKQPLRLACQITVALFNLGLNLWLIPTHGWRGAAWSSLASDGALAMLIMMVVISTSRSIQVGQPVGQPELLNAD
jgi:O-antigen/teichoic acid export membrane protein